jgi:BirA family biotin operon repressor/biotin-[acetyl-CoA-carboxylase] ligase
VVAGCGVNVVRPDDGPEPPPDAAYLEDALDEPTSLSRVAAAVLDGIAEAYARFTADGFAPMQGEYETRFALAGETVTVRDAGGAPFVEGTAAGVDAFGRLVVDGDHGTTAVAAGDVTLKDSARGGHG